MKLNLLLHDAGIDPATVAIVLHSPKEPNLRRRLPWMVVDQPAVFRAYQHNHPRNVEATLQRRAVMASFVQALSGDMIFAGLFAIGPSEEWRLAHFAADPNYQELTWVAGEAEVNNERLDGRAVFDLQPMDQIRTLVGRLIIANPTGRAYVRLAENLDPEILELTRESQLVAAPPDWQDFMITGRDMRVLPRSWGGRLREWRGIYLIVDEIDGARYVGSAYGQDNLFGRWHAHVARDQGVTAELSRRDPANFRFSILQRLDPDLEQGDVLRVETNWKARLHTRDHGLNRN